MDNSIRIFENNQFGQVRTLTINDEPFFVGKDVAEILGYERPDNAIRNHVDEDDRTKTMVFDGIQNRETIIINEPGLYSLIVKNKLQTSAEKEKTIKNFQSRGFLQSVKVNSRKEIEFGRKLEEFFKPMGIYVSKQYRCLDYKIDFFIKNQRIAIEYDENNHQNYNTDREYNRQKAICLALSCSFIRLSDAHSDEHNLGIVTKHFIQKFLGGEAV